MSEFRFVCRDAELNEVITAIKENSIVLMRCITNSGLTHFLKRVMQLLWDGNTACFYINGKSKLSISQQIIGQTMMFSKDDSPEQNKAAKILKKHDTSDLVYSIVTSCLLALDAIPLFPNIGTIANSLITSIKDAIDTDYNHIDDFKTEKAIANFCHSLTKKENKQFILLVDNIQHLESDEYSFLFFLLEKFDIHILFPVSIENSSYELELISKLPIKKTTHYLYRVKNELKRPDDFMIQELYVCYGTPFSPQRLQYYEKCDRNIHIIMADIIGLPLDFSNIDERYKYLLKVLATLEIAIPQSVLFNVLRAEKIESMTLSDTHLEKICLQAYNLGFVIIRDYGQAREKTYELNKQITINSTINVSFVEKQSIISASIRAMDYQIEMLDSSLLEFAISHLDHDYSHSKKYIMAHARKNTKKRYLSVEYIDKLNYLENFEEFIFVLTLYYNLGIYDKPYRLLKTHKEYSHRREYQLAYALICERLHIDNYVDMIENLFATTEETEKKCLLAAVLFVAYLNSDDAKKFKCFFDKSSKYYYKTFQNCQNFYYLLRNVSYYIEDNTSAITNYEKCLSVFFSRDPVNYNRTISNYLCFLMREDHDEIVQKRLSYISQEVKTILDYNDLAYLYLNNNYGIYITRYTDEDPSAFFNSIPFSLGTTETPYIYAQVNLALFYLKKDVTLAFRTIVAVENLVENTSVPRTKQFYAINRALVEYANNIFPKQWIEIIKSKPLRGNKEYSQFLCEKYSSIYQNGILFDPSMINELSLPGYLFYRYFDGKELLS